MEVPDHNGVGYSRGPQGDAYRSRGQLQRHHTIQTCDDAYVSKTLLLVSTDHADHTLLLAVDKPAAYMIKMGFSVYYEYDTLQKGW